MAADILDGQALAQSIKQEVQERVAQFRNRSGRAPKLSVIILGDDPGSRSYVTGKRKACQTLGIDAPDIDLPADTTEIALLDLIQQQNRDPSVDGILVQLPLPSHIDESKVLRALDPGKDVDGFHPFNVGLMMLGRPTFLPCTPHGVLQILLRSGVSTAGAEVVIVGRSNIVGRPLANMLSGKGKAGDATVTLCHSKTKELSLHTRRADILIAALGKAKAITVDMVKKGAVVIDVGVNRIGTSPTGKAILCGDVDFDAVKEVASFITPVPRGVGPMTIAMLMQNTVQAAEKHLLEK